MKVRPPAAYSGVERCRRFGRAPSRKAREGAHPLFLLCLHLTMRVTRRRWGPPARRRPKFGIITLHSGLTLGSGRSVSRLFACVDGFCEVFFPSVSHILDLSTNFFTCGCDLVQSAPEFASE